MLPFHLSYFLYQKYTHGEKCKAITKKQNWKGESVMGQYYKPALINKNGDLKTFNAHDYDNGIKLMEHSYIGNNFVAAILHELVGNPCHVWWLGDYAKIKDFKNNERRLFANERKKIWGKKHDVSPQDTDQTWKYDNAYLINLDKHCYIQLEKCVDDAWQICPLPLLTAVGNGKGGGDYHGDIGKEEVGTWAGDEIMVSYTIPNSLSQKGFIDMTEYYYFKEE